MQQQNTSPASSYPAYPALRRVMILESRYAVRMEVIRVLRASLLFEQVVEATSFVNGISQLQESHFDACIVGSTVNRQKAADFLAVAVQTVLSKDCAFVLLKGDDEEPEIARAHTAISWPCSRRKFTQAMVMAIAEATAEKNWGRMLVHSDMQANSAPHDDSEQGGEGSVADVVDLAHIVRDVHAGKLSLDSSRKPDANASRELDRVTELIFEGHSPSRRIESFKQYFRDALDLWFRDLLTYSPDIATNNLRHSLLSYSKTSR